jgi:hypothetical protein
MHNPPPLTPRGTALWRSLRSRPKGIPAFAVVCGLLIVALASRGSSGGVAFSLLMIFGPLLYLRWLLRRR